MIKGVGKRIVLLNNTESEIFEQAIFILRSNKNIRHEDVVKECERMMNQHITGNRCLNKYGFWKIGFFMLLFCSLVLLLLCICFGLT